MTNKSIEERAIAAFPHYEDMFGKKKMYDNFQMRAAYSLGAQEQDRISRAEERERCIEIAQKVKCKQCELCDDYRQSDGYCSMLKDIRKTMEGGEECLIQMLR